MNGISNYLHEQGGYYVINVGYPSTMLTINDYAQSLDSIIRHLDGVKNISFVAHSMGNIVVRKYLKDLEALTPAMRPPVTFQRMVMISPPNHGAELADTLSNGEVTAQMAQMFAGEPAKELAPKQGWPALEKQLATPNFRVRNHRRRRRRRRGIPVGDSRRRRRAVEHRVEPARRRGGLHSGAQGHPPTDAELSGRADCDVELSEERVLRRGGCAEADFDNGRAVTVLAHCATAAGRGRGPGAIELGQAHGHSRQWPWHTNAKRHRVHRAHGQQPAKRPSRLTDRVVSVFSVAGRGLESRARGIPLPGAPRGTGPDRGLLVITPRCGASSCRRRS